MSVDPEHQTLEIPQTASSSTQQPAEVLVHHHFLLSTRFPTQLTQVLDGENGFVDLKTY